ncbi:MAG: putative quinol monooxygenase [Lachnotalea sp.]
MIKIVAKSFIKEEKLNEYLEVAKKLVEETLTKDKGCIHYELFQDVSNKCIVTMIEEWDDKECLAGHMASEHFKNAIAKSAAFAEKPGEMNIYQKLA